MPRKEDQQSGRMSRTRDAVALLSEDHRKVEKLFDQFKEMKQAEKKESSGKSGGMSKRDIVKKACDMLTIHAQIEEEIFYPALRKALDEDDLLDEALVEHNSAKQMIAELESMRSNEKLYDAKFTVLGEYVRHHVREEEEELFPKARKAKVDFEELGERLQLRKQELEQEKGLKPEDEE